MSRIYLSPPHVGELERELLLRAFDSNWIAPLGPFVDEFEQELMTRIGIDHAVALSSGTAGLHLGLHLLGVQPDDEVITSTLTFAATANAIVYVGAAPVFIDVHKDTWTLDPQLLAEELEACAKRGRLPRAVVTVDLYGQCADYDEVLRICGDYGVPVLEDAAEALGASYRGIPAGRFGDMAVFSFNGNKIITTSGGGMLVSRSGELIAKARHLATQARDPAPHYQHSRIGYNYRLSNLLAAVGVGQLRGLDARLQKRRATNAAYRESLGGLPGVSFMPLASYGETNAWLTCMLVDHTEFGATAENIRVALEAQDIESRPIWKPMHLQPVFADCRMRGGSVSESIFAQGLCLPSGSSLTADQLDQVIDGIKAAAPSVASTGF